MTDSDIERFEAFGHRFAKAQATDVIDLPFGYAILQEQFPLSHDHNRLVVTSAARPADIIAAADEVLGGAGRGHRFVSIGGQLGEDLNGELVAQFAAAGYQHDPVSTMRYSAATEGITASHPVRAVSLDTIRPAILRDWRIDLPKATDEELRQLADRTALYERGATSLRLAVFDGDDIAARADLYLDRADSIAQFENLVTHPDFRNRGYAAALLCDAIQRAREAGADLFFLTADLNDWPHGWYQRFGFVDLALTDHFGTSP